MPKKETISIEGCPEIAEYYQVAADLIKIFFEFVKLRIKNDGIPLCAVQQYDFKQEENVLVPFDPAWEAQARDLIRRKKPMDIVRMYAERLDVILKMHWQDFTVEHYSQRLPAKYLPLIKAPHVRGLLGRARDLAKDNSRVYPSFADVMKPAIHTGTSTITELAAVLGTDFNHLTVLLLATVSLDHVEEMRHHVGIDTADSGIPLPPDHVMIDPHDTCLVNRELLKQFAEPAALGCPAGLRATKGTQQFLKDTLSSMNEAPPTTDRVMLYEFAELVFQDFTRVRTWFQALSEDEKNWFVTKEDGDKLDGTIFRGLVAAAENQGE